MSEAGKLAVLYLYAYLAGSIPTANILARLVKGIDLRDYGSHNVGGSNLAAHVGKWWVIPMGFVDVFIKGASVVWIGHYVPFFGWELTSAELCGAGLIAIAGHNWSAYLKLEGGRGIAVAIGAIYAVAKWQMSLFAGVALLFWFVRRSSGISVYLSMLLLPLWTLVPWEPLRQPLSVTLFLVGVIVLITAKRLLGNWEPLPKDVPKRVVLLNRLFRDRDITPRDEWVYRTPDKTAAKE